MILSSIHVKDKLGKAQKFFSEVSDCDEYQHIYFLFYHIISLLSTP
jgi:hypothetical protein